MPTCDAAGESTDIARWLSAFCLGACAEPVTTIRPLPADFVGTPDDEKCWARRRVLVLEEYEPARKARREDLRPSWSALAPSADAATT